MYMLVHEKDLLGKKRGRGFIDIRNELRTRHIKT